MVSLRRRKLLGLCTGVQNSFLAPLPLLLKNGNAPAEDATRCSNPGSVHPIPLDDLNISHPQEVNDPSREIGSSNVSDSSNSYDQRNQPNQPNISGSTSSKELYGQPITELEVKRRKQHRRRRINNQEQYVLTGVYFKNMKWQAAIKVDKKQIHLGTVSSQEEAARLYDRAAFMCGREPNFELSEEEKQQLRKLKWNEFLAMTRSAINSKRTRRGNVTGKGAPSVQNSDWEGEHGVKGFSASDDADTSTS
ncbi:hypothetical protein BVRB_7g178910 [Beta vulgaris subsp. vulgaris]|uniref:AP2/ERF domain-containing protein n=2 Tax=Beta vulgaris subsp. vulgaris TaxID=3555 RepID=A0A0J8B791_BETVV|nr:ethylene-responsive transcription factor-like protein At4g13040 isoform X2 [Beta vulgaris subsp. vulgaris]KMS97109.1 hypothetical protein BVRB_7g178910 [Beta vulgaris subsp. vulgaris]